MILSDKEIKEAIESKDLIITGQDELHIGPSSLDLHLDSKAMILDDSKFLEGEIMRFDNRLSSSDKFSAYEGWSEITIHPGEFYILSSVERIKFADDMVGFIQGRSSIARMGINIHAAGFFDAGFEGTATLEVTNFTKHPVVIPAFTRICQMVFARTGKKAELPYGKRGTSKYQGQSGPTITSIYKDYEGQS